MIVSLFLVVSYLSWTKSECMNYNQYDSISNCMNYKGYDSISEYHEANPNVSKDTYSTRINLTKAANEDGAVCIDGSVPVFYWRPGTNDGKNKFIIYFDGGGWCGGVNQQVSSCQDTCAHRATTDLGSSNSYPALLDTDKGCMSTNKDINPLAYNWNTVTMRYCDGGSYTGNNDTVVDAGRGIKLHFRGWRILKGLFETLISDYGLSSATDVQVGGCSAGGLTVYMHVDYIYKTYIPSTANFMGLIDSGFFMQYEGSGQYISAMKWLWNNMNVTDSMNMKCMDHYRKTGDTFQCMFAQNISPFMQVKVFNMQSRYDSWQDGCELQSNNPKEINNYGQNLTSVYQIMYENSNGNNSNAELHAAYLDSCSRHCDDGDWYGITIDGYTQSQAQYAFYNDENKHSRIWFQNETYPCKSCC